MGPSTTFIHYFPFLFSGVATVTRMAAAMDFGEKVKKAMGGRSYSEIARIVACSPETIRKVVDHGSLPRLDRALRICRAVNIPIDWASDPETDWPPPATDEQTATGLVQQALAGAGLAGELADDERTLLTGWRRLPDGPRQRILGMMQGFLDAGEAFQSTDPKDLEMLRKVEALLKRDAARPQQLPKPEERTA